MKRSYVVVSLFLTLGIGFFAGRASETGNSANGNGEDGPNSRAIAQVRSREPVRGIELLDQLARSPLMANQTPSPRR